MKRMTWIERRHLEKYCDKYGIDYQEIDNSLTYDEAKKHLREIKQMLSQSLDAFELARMEEQQREDIEQNPLVYYRSHLVFGETKSDDIGKPDLNPPQFSLKTRTATRFSLRTFKT